jgi:hypothetical protein
MEERDFIRRGLEARGTVYKRGRDARDTARGTNNKRGQDARDTPVPQPAAREMAENRHNLINPPAADKLFG